MIQGPALGGRHQPRAGMFRNARRRPMLEGRHQGLLRQIFRQGYVAQHPRQAGCAKLANTLPARHEVLVQLHELLRRRQSFRFVAQLEDRVTADDLLGLHERTVDNAELAVRDAHLGAGSHGHQPTIVKDLEDLRKRLEDVERELKAIQHRELERA